jgi:hypothetical protein
MADKGQPTKFTPETKKKLLYAISKGATYDLACKYARISYDVFALWRRRANQEGIEEFVNFFNDLKEVEGSTALHWLQKIDDAMEKELWTAAAWKLERIHSKAYSANAGMIELNERFERLENLLKSKGERENEEGT